jgi:nitrogen-specific signal transduction histidine kinase
VFWIGPRFSINVFLASLVILILFNPLSDLVEGKIAEFFFRERHILEQEVASLRRHLLHVIDMEAMVAVLREGLEPSKRLTHAALYLMDTHGRGFDLKMSVGPPPAATRVESAVARLHLQPHFGSGVAVALGLAAQRERLLQTGQREKAQQMGETLDLMDALTADVLLPIQAEEQLLGFISFRDDRRKDPFSPEDVDLLRGLASQIVITVENSRLYQQTIERDRLAALGRMAAGLAHEIRNPLGSIKGAAQVVEELAKAEAGEDYQELLGVIVEEVDRLDRVVYDFLTYARPTSGRPQLLSINDIVERTIQVFETRLSERMEIEMKLADEMPLVRVDSERLHQVFLNLMLNAAEALNGTSTPRLEITTRVRAARSGIDDGSTPASGGRFVEARFADNGPGLTQETLENIFIPFFTTKQKGSGLGLSICLRIIRDAGGDIEVRSQAGEGTIFTVLLPIQEADGGSRDSGVR